MGVNVGDKVKIRSYDSLVNEYGTKPDGSIKRGFVPSMNEFCGKYGEIIVVDIPDIVYRVEFGKLVRRSFCYSDDTLVHKEE